MVIEYTGADPLSGFRYIEFRPATGHMPESAILYLHGSGERGESLSAVKHYGLPAMIARGSVTLNGAVICPLLASDQQWESARLAHLINTLSRQYQTVVLMGFSLGGTGVCQLQSDYAALVPYAIAIAARGPANVNVGQHGAHFLAIHGEHDLDINAVAFALHITECGGHAENVILAGKDHYISEDAMWNEKLIAVLSCAGIEIMNKDKSAQTVHHSTCL